MSTAVAPPRDVIKHVAPDELEARRRIIVSELERRFGSLDAALAQEYTGSHRRRICVFSAPTTT